nr:hypothetical protein [uncultured Flavobacterium sp.]
MSITNWNQLQEEASRFILFLNKGEFFKSKYEGVVNSHLIITDETIGINYASNTSFESFDEWETISDSVGVFPENFEWHQWINNNLQKNNYFDFVSKNFNGADAKWTKYESCVLIELMYRDIRIILNCYANNCFPPIWKQILEVYLNNGFPCGWSGISPEGKLVVFSNK